MSWIAAKRHAEWHECCSSTMQVQCGMVSPKDRVASKRDMSSSAGPISGRRPASAPLIRGLPHGVCSIKGTVRGQSLSRRSSSHRSASTASRTHNDIEASVEGGSCAHSLADGSRAPADFPATAALGYPDPVSDVFYDDEVAHAGPIDEPGKAAQSCSQRLAWVATGLTLASSAPSLLASAGATAPAMAPVPLFAASASSWLVRSPALGYHSNFQSVSRLALETHCLSTMFGIVKHALTNYTPRQKHWVSSSRCSGSVTLKDPKHWMSSSRCAGSVSSWIQMVRVTSPQRLVMYCWNRCYNTSDCSLHHPLAR